MILHEIMYLRVTSTRIQQKIHNILCRFAAGLRASEYSLQISHKFSVDIPKVPIIVLTKLL